MRKCAYLFILVCAAMMTIATGCTDKKPEANDTTATADTTAIDTVDTDTVATIIAETPMPKAADQLFDDFFFNFIASKKVQRSRILFPLAVITATGEKERTKTLAKEQWKMDKFFRPQGYYTLIFDNEKQMELAKSTDIDTVIVEKIHLRRGEVEQFCFDHQEGRWRMNAIKTIRFAQSQNASFLTFLAKFLQTDGEGMVKNPLPYSGPDPEGDGEETTTVNTNIEPSLWSTFIPEVPGDLIYNILYGQEYKAGKRKILTFKGLSNGLETQFVFQKNGKSWMLVKVNAY